MTMPSGVILPITPKELEESFDKRFPDFVINGINNALKKHYRGKFSTTIKQEEIEKEIMSLAPSGFLKGELYEKSYLDFEKYYTQFGWDVKYNSPAMDESFDSYYTFKIKNKS